MISSFKQKKMERERTAGSRAIAISWVGSGACVPFRRPEPTKGNRNKARLLDPAASVHLVESLAPATSCGLK